MKKNIIYGILACCLCAMTACEEDYAESTSKHVYGPNENQPVKTNVATTVTHSMEFQAAQATPVVVDIYDYDDVIRDAFGISAQELAGKIGSEYFMVPINPNRMVWLKSVSANTGDTYGWYINKSGNVCEGDDDATYGKLVYDEASHSFEFGIRPDVSGSMGTQIGIVKAGTDFVTHVRFVLNVTTLDKSYIFRDIVIPAGDYSAYQMTFDEVAEGFDYVFGMTPAEYDAAYDAGKVAIYMFDKSLFAYNWDAAPTANNGGFWCNAAGEVITWGDGCCFYIEPWTGTDGGNVPCFAIGRFPGIESGTQVEIRFGTALVKNHDKVVNYIINATFE